MENPDRSVRVFSNNIRRWLGKNRQYRAVCLAYYLVRGTSGQVAHKADRIVNTQDDQVGPGLVSNGEHAVNGVTIFHRIFDVAPLTYKLRNQLAEFLIKVRVHSPLIRAEGVTLRSDMNYR